MFTLKELNCTDDDITKCTEILFILAIMESAMQHAQQSYIHNQTIVMIHNN